jgi:hypothetical protein
MLNPIGPYYIGGTIIMSITEKKLLANRANAQKSTGPVTASGKTISSMNAVKHGLCAATPVINSPRLKEDQVEYDLLLSSLIEELDPHTPLQEHLVRKIAACLWRSRRLVAAESAQIATQLDSIRPDRLYIPSFGFITGQDLDGVDFAGEKPVPSDIKARAFSNLIGVKSIPNDSFNSNLMLYEMRLDRQLTRALRLLRQLKQNSKTQDFDKPAENPENKESFKSEQSNPDPTDPNLSSNIPPDGILTG